MRLMLLIPLLAFALGADPHYDPRADPEKDLAAARAEAARLDKRILVKVGGEWCGWCHRMDKFIAGTASVKAKIEKGFVVLKVNYSEENRNEKFLGRFPKVKGYPHLFVLDSDGRLLHSQDTGQLEERKGYSRERFEGFLDQWSPGR
jgi:thioredoxin-related protein